MNSISDILRTHRGAVAAALLALLAGLGAGYWLSRSPGSAAGKPDEPIEWTKMQAVPTRAPDVEDKEWQNRVEALDKPEGPAPNSGSENNNDTAKLENADQ